MGIEGKSEKTIFTAYLLVEISASDLGLNGCDGKRREIIVNLSSYSVIFCELLLFSGNGRDVRG